MHNEHSLHMLSVSILLPIQSVTASIGIGEVMVDWLAQTAVLIDDPRVHDAVFVEGQYSEQRLRGQNENALAPFGQF